MSLLQAAARRAIRHHCSRSNESLVLIRSDYSRRQHCSSRCSIQPLSTLTSGCKVKPNDNGSQISVVNSRNYIIGTEQPMLHRLPSVGYHPSKTEEAPLLSSPFSSIHVRYFSAPAPQKETQHISTSLGNNDDLQKVDLQEKDPSSDGGRVNEEADYASTKKVDESNAALTSEEMKLTKQAVVTDKKETSVVKKAQDLTLWAVQSLVSLLAKTPGVLWFYLTNPTEFRKKLGELKDMAVKEAHHYWMGSKVRFDYCDAIWTHVLTSFGGNSLDFTINLII